MTSADGLTTVSGVVTATATAGEWEIKYTLTVSGTYSLQIELDPNGSTLSEPIFGSPFTVSCQVSDTDPVQTTITGAGTTAAIAGEVTSFTVT